MKHFHSDITKEEVKKAYKVFRSSGVKSIDKRTMQIIHVMLDHPQSNKMKNKEYLDFIHRRIK